MRSRRRELPELVTQIEKEVLDEHFKSFALLCRNQDVAILNLLCAYGDHARHFSRPEGSGVSHERRRQSINEAARGLAWCVRWLVQCAPARIWLPQRPKTEIPAEARDFLIWGFQYEALFNCHWPARFGFLDVTIEEASKTIRFKYAYDADPIQYLSQVEARQKNTDAPMDAELRNALESCFGDWIERAQSDRASGSIEWPSIHRSHAFTTIHAWFERTFWPSVSNSLNCGGFEMGEMRRCLAVVYVFCQYVSKFEDVLDRTPNNVGSNVFSYSFEEWVRLLSEMASARRDAVRAILRVLTLDVTDQHATVFSKPFIHSATSQIFMSPRLFVGLDLVGMLTVAFNSCEPSRSAYADAISRIVESADRDAIEMTLSAALPLRILNDKRLTGPDGTLIKPDFLIFDESSAELMVTDYKNTSEPHGPRGVRDRLSDLENEWMPKIKKYREFIEKNPRALLQYLPCMPITGPTAIHGLILTRCPLPLPTRLPDDIALGDWPSLQRRIEQVKVASVRELHDWLRERPDLRVPANVVYQIKTIRVGEWTYECDRFVPQD